MNESELKSLIDSLQGLRASLDIWLNLCAALVVIGVVLEVAFIFREYSNDLQDWRRGVIHPPERPNRLWLIFELFGVALVAVGVAGEFFIDVRAGNLETQIRKANEQLVLILEQEAGAASTSATEAAAAASRAESSAANATEVAHGARTEADSFERDIVSAKTQAAEAESHLASALRQAADAEREVIRLNGVLADRQLTDSQLGLIAGKLRRYRGQEYTVTAYWESKESLGIANRIHAALQRANWTYNPEGSNSQMLGGIIGVFVWTHPNANETTLRAADSLVEALNAEGIEAARQEQNPNNPKTNRIAINVGAKR